jgi:hypothetical protein
MRTVMKVAVATMLACGGLLLVLGIVIWTGSADQLIGVHVALGVVLIVSLWTIIAIAARSGVPMNIVAFAAGWSLVVVILGLAQEELVPGSWHWSIQVLHLGISMGAIWWGRRLAGLIRQARATASPANERGLVPEA